MTIKELLGHVYPACRVRLIFNDAYGGRDSFDGVCQKIYDTYGDCKVEDWAVYHEYIRIWL